MSRSVFPTELSQRAAPEMPSTGSRDVKHSVPRAREISSQSFQAGFPSVRRARSTSWGSLSPTSPVFAREPEEVGEDDALLLEDGRQLFEGILCLQEGDVSSPAFWGFHVSSFGGGGTNNLSIF